MINGHIQTERNMSSFLLHIIHSTTLNDCVFMYNISPNGSFVSFSIYYSKEVEQFKLLYTIATGTGTDQQQSAASSIIVSLCFLSLPSNFS